MIQGTASSVGKSIITAGLCRIFCSDGYAVAPFKSQNMSLNSFVTSEGHEMGRAQVVQAQACRLRPSSLMNPILLKPTGHRNAQVVLNGIVYKNMTAAGYHEYKSKAKTIVTEAYKSLAEKFDIIVIEGAGSPAEINLRDNDIVNMGMAEIADSPVILVSDIDRGGVFASIAGTMLLLNDRERERVKGVIINKFRGDIELLKPGLTMLEDIIKIPVLGVVPYIDINLEDEDSVTERFNPREGKGDIEIDIIRLPHISNFTDFDVFRLFEDVKFKFIEKAEDIENPDIIIIPGTKNTIEDLRVIKENGIADKIIGHHNLNKLIIGICGGYQMMGRSIRDPHRVESSVGQISGLGFIEMDTILEKKKLTEQVKGSVEMNSGILKGLIGAEIKGYEIHMGISRGSIENRCFIRINNRISGIAHENIMGTYIHGIFDNQKFTRGLLNNIRAQKGLEPVKKFTSVNEEKEKEFNRLAHTLRKSIDIDKIYKIMDQAGAASS